MIKHKIYQASLCDMELKYSVFECHRAKQLQTSRQLIEDLIQRNITTNDSN